MNVPGEEVIALSNRLCWSSLFSRAGETKRAALVVAQTEIKDCARVAHIQGVRRWQAIVCISLYTQSQSHH